MGLMSQEIKLLMDGGWLIKLPWEVCSEKVIADYDITCNSKKIFPLCFGIAFS